MAHGPRPRLRAASPRSALPGARRNHALTLHALRIGSGRPLLWLHGFPDCPDTAHEFFRALDRAVIAPYLRGYAPSPTHGPYDVETLARDVLALVDEPIDVVGHDWGAAITYTLCMLAPSRIRRAVTLACPHPRTLLRMLRNPAQLRRSWYMAFFQLPFSARIARARDFALIDRLWRTWSPSFTLDEGCRKMLHSCLSQSWPAPIRYYQPQRFRGDHITTPLLQLHGSDDGCIAPPTDEDSFRFRARTLEIVPRVGHFMHLEDPSGIALRIRNWFA